MNLYRLVLLCLFLQLGYSQADQQRVSLLIKKGDEHYAQKNGYNSFSESLKYFDEAHALAIKTGDSLLIGEAIFAKGRVYDAWNKEPQKTIEYFSKAAAIFSRYSSDTVRTLYVKHLVAHAYDKVKDSLNCTRVLFSLSKDLARLSPKTRNNIRFIPQLALIATEIKNYLLAENFLSMIKEEEIKNDPETYNYRDNYFITKSRLEVLYYKKSKSKYLDSLALCFSNAKNVWDSAYYSHELRFLYVKGMDYKKAVEYADVYEICQTKINNKEGIESLKNQLLSIEMKEVQRNLAYEKERQRFRNIVILVLSILLVAIASLLFAIYKSYQKQKELAIHLSQTNLRLNEALDKNELLNKETHHRIKNNLYMIVSLLQMQERKTENVEAAQILQTTRNRIGAIASLHSKLSEDREIANFKEFITALVSTTVECLSEYRKVVTHIEVNELSLSPNQSFCLSLILNEWVTNSLKYAKPAQNVLELHLTMKRNATGIEVEYFDNGQVQDRVKKVVGMGERIIHLLVQQMKASFVENTSSPFHFHLRIPDGN